MKCPFTSQDIDSIDPFNVAVIYHQSSCTPVVDIGDEDHKKSKDQFCMCSLNHLIDDFYSSKPSCPVCLKQDITSIYDGISNSFLGDNNHNNEWKKHYDIISFKFNKHLYYLTILKKEKQHSWFRSVINRISPKKDCADNAVNYNSLDIYTLAHERIAAVLEMDSKENIKILYKGKVIYPNSLMTSEQISKNIIDISGVALSSSSSSPPRKVSSHLVVMGTRRCDVIQEKKSYRTSNILKHVMSKRNYYLLGVVVLIFGKKILKVLITSNETTEYELEL